MTAFIIYSRWILNQIQKQMDQDFNFNQCFFVHFSYLLKMESYKKLQETQCSLGKHSAGDLFFSVSIQVTHMAVQQ